MRETALKASHRAFVAAYRANGGNRELAAEAAGFRGTKGKLQLRADELLKREDVQAALAELEREAAEVAAGDIDQDERGPIADAVERQEFWTSVMRARDEQGGAVKISFRERLLASQLLARAQGDFRGDGDDPPNPDEVDALRFVPLRADDDLDGRNADKDLNAAVAGAAGTVPDAPRRK